MAPRLLLWALLVTLGAASALLGQGANAVFTHQAQNPANTFTSDALDPPTSLSASPSGGSIVLNWTATVDTYASGHRVYRGTAAGGPYSQIAEVTPRTTTTYTDSTASSGVTYYYVLRSFFQNWESVNSNEASAMTSPAGIQVGNSSSAASVGKVTSLTWSHTVGSGSARILVVGVSIRKHDMSVTNITYGGVGGFVFVGTWIGGGADHRVEIWYKLAPPVGTANVAVTLGGGAAVEVVGGAVSFTGVHQTTPVGTFVGANGSSTAPAVAVASAAGEVVIDVLSASGDSGLVSAGPGQIQRWGGSTGTGDGNEFGAGSTKSGAASVTMSWTMTNSNKWALGAVPLKPAP